MRRRVIAGLLVVVLLGAGCARDDFRIVAWGSAGIGLGLAAMGMAMEAATSDTQEEEQEKMRIAGALARWRSVASYVSATPSVSIRRPGSSSPRTVSCWSASSSPPSDPAG